jgi:hypothetical protein
MQGPTAVVADSSALWGAARGWVGSGGVASTLQYSTMQVFSNSSSSRGSKRVNQVLSALRGDVGITHQQQQPFCKARLKLSLQIARTWVVQQGAGRGVRGGLLLPWSRRKQL